MHVIKFTTLITYWFSYFFWNGLFPSSIACPWDQNTVLFWFGLVYFHIPQCLTKCLVHKKISWILVVTECWWYWYSNNIKQWGILIETSIYNTNMNADALLKKNFNVWLPWKKIIWEFIRWFLLKWYAHLLEPRIWDTVSHMWEMDTRQSLETKQDWRLNKRFLHKTKYSSLLIDVLSSQQRKTKNSEAYGGRKWWYTLALHKAE